MRLASLWQDHAVVQRGKKIVVWGWCEAKRTKIRATLGPVSAYGVTAIDGRFELRLPPLPAGGPYELNVKTINGEEATVKDILVGEVWLVSGQSNAEFPLRTFVDSDPLSQTEQYLNEGGDTPLIRCFTSVNDALDATGDELFPNKGWQISNPDTAPDFTAIGAWFAFYFHKQFPEIPVGIIHSSWGGTIVSAWMSRSALSETDADRLLLDMDDDTIANPLLFDKLEDVVLKPVTPWAISDDLFEKLCVRDPGNKGYALGYAAVDFDDSGWKNMAVPGSWMLQEISGNGAVWMRRTIDLPASWTGQPLELHLGGVDKMDTTYFNNVQVGATGSGFDTSCWDQERNYPVPADAVKAGKNVIAVRAYSFFFDGSMSGLAKKYYLLNKTTGETISLAAKEWKAFAEFAFQPKPFTRLDASITDPNAPHRLFDNKIRPLVSYGIRGVLWYQGESDADCDDRTDNYLRRFSSMIRDWRYRWAQGDDFPFYFVQLANYQASHPALWLRIQDAQRRAYLQVPNTGCITATDLALFEPTDIHPHDKRTFGYRLFQVALANTYGAKDIIPQGPTLDKVRPDGSALRLHFLFADGLKSRDGQPLRGFEIAGTDGVFTAAQAFIDGDEVVLSADSLRAPSQCRYNAKLDLPEGNLVNKADLPALSFISEIDY